MTTDNYRKHTSNNPIQKLFINNFYKMFLYIIKPLGVESVLDVGCGEGFTLNKLYQNKVGKSLEGIDYSLTAVMLGKKQNKKLMLRQGDIYKLPYKEKSFDIVLCMEVLEHLEDPKKALKELKRVSKKYILLSVPNEPIFTLANLARGKNLARWGNDREHIQHWSSSSFERFVVGAGFEKIEKKHPFPWTMLLLEKR